MIIRNLLFGSVPFVLCSLLAPDTGAPAGGGGAPEPAAPPAEPAAPAAPAPAAPETKEPKPGEYDPTNPPPGEPRTDVRAAAPVKPTAFQRAAALLQPRMQLAAQISAKDETIRTLTADKARLEAELNRTTAELSSLRTQMNEFETQLDTLANDRATDIAAGQGVPAVPTKPATSHATVDDEVAELRDQANQTVDPVKRAELHAKADRLADQKAKQRNN